MLSVTGTVGVVAVTGCLRSSDLGQWNLEDAVEVGAARMYSAPGCSCCSRYASYLRDNVDGDVSEVVRDDLDAVKREHGVPDELRSCHTLVVDEYVVEGHVPAAAIARLLDERPSVDGVAVPGMPAGSPGMGGEVNGHLEVYEFGEEQTGVYDAF